MSEENATTKPVDAIRFTDQEAVKLVKEEAAKTGEPLAKVASRIIIKFFAAQGMSKNSRVEYVA